MRKFYLLAIVFTFFLLFSFTNIVNAACDPAECGIEDHPNCDYIDPTYQCLAKCCVIPAGGGGGGSPTPPPGPGY